MTFTEALDAFTRPPLDEVQIDLDLKLAGREDEVVAAIRERGLMERTMTSTMEVESIAVLRELAPELRTGWTYPRTTATGWGRGGAARSRGYSLRPPAALAAETIPRLGVRAMWAYPVVAARLADAAHDAGVELIAWTVDDLARMRPRPHRGRRDLHERSALILPTGERGARRGAGRESPAP